MSKNKMQEFKQKIKEMLNAQETKEPTYGNTDVHIVRDTKQGKISICTKEVLSRNEEKYRITVGANHIGDGEQMAEYELQSLPAGRACFGGYTNKEVNQDKELYSFSDVWYKLYGTPLEPHRKFTQKDLLTIEQEMQEKWREAKFTQIYSIKCKEQPTRKKAFVGTKYFASCIEDQEKTPYFETIDKEGAPIQVTGNARNGNVTLILEGKKIGVEDLVYGTQIVKSKESEFEIQVLDTIGVSRVYTKARYTTEACKRIIEEHERKQEELSL